MCPPREKLLSRGEVHLAGAAVSVLRSVLLPRQGACGKAIGCDYLCLVSEELEILFGAPLEEVVSQRLLVSREVTLAGQVRRVPVSLESPHPSLQLISRELDLLPAAQRASQHALSCVEKGEITQEQQ